MKKNTRQTTKKTNHSISKIDASDNRAMSTNNGNPDNEDVTSTAGVELSGPRRLSGIKDKTRISAQIQEVTLQWKNRF